MFRLQAIDESEPVILLTVVQACDGAPPAYALAMYGRVVIFVHESNSVRDEAITALCDSWPFALHEHGYSIVSDRAQAVRSADGRCLGWRTGVLFNLEEMRDELTSRGHHGDGFDAAKVCTEVVAQSGLKGLQRLRFHGGVAVLHRGQGTLMLSADPIGLAPWTRGEFAGCLVWSSCPLFAATLETPRRSAPGATWLLRGADGQVSFPQFDGGPFVRQRPAALLGGEDMEHVVTEALRDAARRWSHDRGALAVCDDPRLGDLGGDATGCRWSPIGLDTLAEASPWPPPWSDLNAETRTEALIAWSEERFGERWRPPEPTARVEEPRRSERWLRYTWWLEERLIPALHTSDAPVAVPHLDPAVIALLGGMSHAQVQSLRRWRRSGL